MNLLPGSLSLHLRPFICWGWLVVIVWCLCPEISHAVNDDAFRKRALEKQVMMLINFQREKKELPLLTPDPSLQQLADQWSLRLARLNRMEHRKNLSTIQKALGFSYLNENLYRSSAVPEAERVVEAWMDSKGHRRNLLSPRSKYGAVSVGFTKKGGTIIVFHGGGERIKVQTQQQKLQRLNQGYYGTGGNSSLNSKSR